MTTSKALILLATAALLAAGCGGSNTESHPAGPSESTVNPSQMTDEQAPPDRLLIEVSITGPDQVTPVNEQLHAAVKEPIVIQVSSDVDDELHVHSTPEHTFKVEPKPGQSFQFTVDVPGQVDVELHKLNKTIATIEVQ